MTTPTSTRAATPASTTPTKHSRGVIGHLNLEWSTTLGPQPVPKPWTARFPELAAPTIGDLLAQLRTANGAEADRRLHALLTLNHAGHALAGRTLVQAMLGKVVKLGPTARGRGLGDPHESILLALWETITRYPLRRTKSVAANLALDTLHRLSPAETTTLIPAGLATAAEAVSDPSADDCPRWERDFATALRHDVDDRAETFEEVLVRTLMWAQDHQVLSPAEIEVIGRLHLAPEASYASVANDIGSSPGAVRQRHSRGIRKLARAVVDRLDEPLAQP